MIETSQKIWHWQDLDVAWSCSESEDNQFPPLLFIHGFGANKHHWRNNQPVLAKITNCYAIDLIGFGNSSQPKSRLRDESNQQGEFLYCFDTWANQVVDFCIEVIKSPVVLVGNSIGGVIALRAAKSLKNSCSGVVLIDCAQRKMDDKRLNEQPSWMQISRPWLKNLVRQRWLSTNLFRNAANPTVIRKVLNQAYPSGENVDEHLIELLRTPSNRSGASEAFRGFINLFNDYLAPDILKDLETPVDLIWGEKDPWESVDVANEWFNSFPCIRSMEVIPDAGHCPHDEAPEMVNSILIRLIQQAA